MTYLYALLPLSPALVMCLLGWLGLAGKIVPLRRVPGFEKATGASGRTNGFKITIDPKYDQPWLIEHEKCHVNQIWKGLWFFDRLAYSWIPAWKRRQEAEAFAVSVKHGYPIERAAEALHVNYGFASRDAARKAVEKFL